MALNPLIFISATSTDLASARDLVAKILTMLGYTPIWQDIAGTDSGRLQEVLRTRINPCAAMIQLVGQRFGAEPPTPDPKFGRISYTQYEALYAESIGKQVTYIFLRPDFPTDPCEPEASELAGLQATYRSSLKDRGVLRHPASSEVELENRILRIRDELARIRAKMERDRRYLQAAGIIGLVFLGLIGWEVWHLRQATQNQGSVVEHIDAGVQQILSLPAPERADRLADSLASASAGDLVLLSKAGASSYQIQTAMARTVPGGKVTVGYSFFDNSRNNLAAIEWFKAALKAGLDPNYLLPDPYWEFRSLLNNALLAANASAAIVLLDAGASPHQYENITRKIPPEPTFLFPYGALVSNSRLSLAEKHQIADAFRRCGACYFQDAPPSENQQFFYESHSGINDSEQQIGFKLENTLTISQQPDSWLFRVALARGQNDWVNFIHTMPRTVVPSTESHCTVEPFEVRYFLGIYRDNAYFMATAPLNHHYLIEVARSQIHWTLYAYTSEEAGKGFVIDETGKELDSSSYAEGWLTWNLTYDARNKEIVVDNYYHYKVAAFQRDQ